MVQAGLQQCLTPLVMCQTRLISPAADRLQHPRTLEAAIISVVYAVDSQLGHLAQVPRW
jgi:hypothetical protein